MSGRATFVTTAVIVTLTVALDQITKWYVYTQLVENVDEIPVIPGFFSIVHAQNPGAAMGMLSTYEYRYVVFLVFTVIAVVVIVDMWRKLHPTDRFTAFILGLILSGAVGNGIDRVHKQTVTDFLRVYTEVPSLKMWLIETFGTNEWPSFNVADSALVVGVALFFVQYLFFEGDKDESEEAAALSENEDPETA